MIAYLPIIYFIILFMKFMFQLSIDNYLKKNIQLIFSVNISFFDSFRYLEKTKIYIFYLIISK